LGKKRGLPGNQGRGGKKGGRNDGKDWMKRKQASHLWKGARRGVVVSSYLYRGKKGALPSNPLRAKARQRGAEFDEFTFFGWKKRAVKRVFISQIGKKGKSGGRFFLGECLPPPALTKRGGEGSIC